MILPGTLLKVDYSGSNVTVSTSVRMNSQRSKMARAQRHGGGEARETARALLHGVMAPLLLVTLQQSKQMWQFIFLRTCKIIIRTLNCRFHII